MAVVSRWHSDLYNCSVLEALVKDRGARSLEHNVTAKVGLGSSVRCNHRAVMLYHGVTVQSDTKGLEKVEKCKISVLHNDLILHTHTHVHLHTHTVLVLF